jgi:hypothetical protein
MLDQSRVLTVSGRLYSLLLMAYPTRFRRAYGREMAQVFRDDIRGTFQEGGPAGLIRLWFLVVLDLLKTAFAEHIWEVFHMPVEKLERWSGLAAALGGALLVFLTLSLTLSSWPAEVIAAVLFLAMYLLWAIALTGLYRRLPAASHPGNKVTFAIAGISLLLASIGFLILYFTDSVDIASMAYIGGNIGIIPGIAGMGIIALRYRAMGVWRFVPLLLAVAWLGFILSIIQGFTVDSPVQLAFLFLTGVCWLLLGIGLWTSAKQEAGPALPA